MTTAYTPILQLALPVVGELNGTWGTVANDNITSMIEQAIAGLATINTWTTASHTLTTADGTTDEARCAMLECSGAPGAAATVICPARTKLFVIKNSVTGGFAVTLKTSAGTGISVPNGSTALLYCDGTNVVSGATYMASLVTTSITDSGLTSGRVVYAGTGGLLQDAAALTFDGTTLAATKFAGALNGSVGATTPNTGVFTFVTNSSLTSGRVPYAGTGGLVQDSANLAFNGTVLTATGFAGPLNGAVGGTTPAAGAFTTLSTTGAITVNGSAGSLGQPLFSSGPGVSPVWGGSFVIDLTDIGYAANQIPLNQYLGRLAYQDALSASDDGANVFVGVSDVGYNANQVPLNQYLGSLAYQSAESAEITSLAITQPISTPSLAPTIASATTIAPVNYITFISGTTAIVNITPTAVMANGGGALILIPTGAFTTTTAGNIALASTATVGRAMTMVYDSNTTKWYPSY